MQQAESPLGIRGWVCPFSVHCFWVNFHHYLMSQKVDHMPTKKWHSQYQKFHLTIRPRASKLVSNVSLDENYCWKSQHVLLFDFVSSYYQILPKANLTVFHCSSKIS